MSFNTVVTSTPNQASLQIDLKKLFVFNNRYEKDNYINNSGYDPIILPAGTVMGRVATTGVLVPFTSTASDGSQFILGILAQDVQLAAGATQQAAICIAGDVAGELVQFSKIGDGFDTVVSSRRVRDKIQGETVGIILRFADEQLQYDN